MTRNSEHGYSLIELLVVLALLGLIALATSGGIGFGARVWERSQSTVEDLDQVRGTQLFLRTLIGEVYPRQTDSNASTEEATFFGEPQRISFLALAPDTIGGGGVVRIELSRDQAGPSFALNMKWTRPSAGNADVQRNLVDSARAIAFSFGTVQPNGETAWADTWDGRSGVPTLVRLRIIFDDSKKLWPDLIIHPMIDKDATCIYDPVSFSCRHG